MKRKILAVLAGVSLLAIAAPAQANQTPAFRVQAAAPLSGGTINNCPNNQICLFDGTNYGTYHWSHHDFPSLVGTCTNLTDWSTWFTNIEGSTMNNAVSSVIVNPDSVYAGGTTNVTFWPNANCAGTPRPYHLMGEGLGLDADLTNGGFHISANWSNQMTSVRVSAS